MANTQAMGQADLKLKMKEAETCYSMGMMKDALSVYEQILSGSKIQDNQINETIRHKISQLKKELAEQEAAENQGMSAEDISIFKNTLSGSEDVTTILDGARALKELGLLEEAIIEYEKLLDFDFSKSDYSKFDYSPAEIIHDYLVCITETKPPQDVVKRAYKVIYNQTLKDPEIAQLKFWLGTEMEKRVQNELALELYKKASEIDPTNSEIINKLNSLTSRISSSSRYDYLLSKKQVTTQQLQEALALDQTKAEIWITLGVVLLQKGEFSKAANLMQRAVISIPEEPTLYHLLGTSYLRQGMFLEAISSLKKSLSLAPDDRNVMRDLAVGYERAGLWGRAEGLLQRLLALDPKDDWVMNYLGYMLADRGIRLQEALELVKRALEINPQNSNYLDSLGWIYFRQGKLSQAEEYLVKAIDRSGDEPVLYDHLGDVYLQQGRQTEAIRQWKTALELNPDDEKIRDKLDQLEP